MTFDEIMKQYEPANAEAAVAALANRSELHGIVGGMIDGSLAWPSDFDEDDKASVTQSHLANRI